MWEIMILIHIGPLCRHHLATSVHVIRTCTTSITHTIYHISDAHIRIWLSHKSHYFAAHHIRWRDANLWLHAPVTCDIVCCITMPVRIYIIWHLYLYVHKPITISVRVYCLAWLFIIACDVFARATNELGNFSTHSSPSIPVWRESDRIIIDRIYEWIYICSPNISLRAIRWGFASHLYPTTNTSSPTIHHLMDKWQSFILWYLVVCCVLRETTHKKNKNNRNSHRLDNLSQTLMWPTSLPFVAPNNKSKPNWLQIRTCAVRWSAGLVNFPNRIPNRTYTQKLAAGFWSGDRIDKFRPA